MHLGLVFENLFSDFENFPNIQACALQYKAVHCHGLDKAGHHQSRLTHAHPQDPPNEVHCTQNKKSRGPGDTAHSRSHTRLWRVVYFNNSTNIAVGSNPLQHAVALHSRSNSSPPVTSMGTLNFFMKSTASACCLMDRLKSPSLSPPKLSAPAEVVMFCVPAQNLDHRKQNAYWLHELMVSCT